LYRLGRLTLCGPVLFLIEPPNGKPSFLAVADGLPVLYFFPGPTPQTSWPFLFFSSHPFSLLRVFPVLTNWTLPLALATVCLVCVKLSQPSPVNLGFYLCKFLFQTRRRMFFFCFFFSPPFLFFILPRSGRFLLFLRILPIFVD